MITREISKESGDPTVARSIRIHQSAIVNSDRIREVQPEGSSRYSVVLADGTRLVLSRQRADRLRDWRL